MSIDLNHLRYFYEVSKRGGFTRASLALRVSQPGISKVIKTLEEREGVKLLERGRRGVTLTPMGEVLFQSCAEIFEKIDSTRRFMSGNKDACAGILALGASDNICNYVLPELLNRFMTDYPKVTTSVLNGTSESIKAELLEGRTEVGIFHSPVRDPQFTVERLGFVEFLIVYSPEKNSFAKGRRVTAKDLPHVPFLGPRANDYRNPLPLCNMLGSIGVVPKVIFESNSQETQRRFALTGYGYAVLPHYMVGEDLATGRFRKVKTPKKVGSNVFLVMKRGKSLSRPALLFTERVRERFLSLRLKECHLSATGRTD